MEAERREADAEGRASAAHLVEMCLELRHGLVQRLQRRAGQLELPGRLQRDRRVALLQPDGVAAIEDRRRRRIRASPPAGRGSSRAGRRPDRRAARQVGVAEAEFLMLGADAELFRRLAAGGDMIGQLPERRDRGRVGVSGIGHVAPRRGGFGCIGVLTPQSAACNSASPAMQAVSARRMRGPSETGGNKGMRAHARQAPPA